MTRRIFPLAAAALAATQIGATDCGQIIDDRGFDLWCGEQLCTWALDSGEIRRVPTWHRGDDGVELLGPDGAISQLTEVTSLDGTCIRFAMIASIEETAEVELSLDLGGDGSFEHAERIPTSDWRRVSFLLAVAPPFDGIRFRLARQGDGRAVLANIGAETAEGCGGTPIIAAPPATTAGRGTVDGPGAAP